MGQTAPIANQFVCLLALLVDVNSYLVGHVSLAHFESLLDVVSLGSTGL
jgi:hypothetical protein